MSVPAWSIKLGTEVKRARELGSYRLEEKLGEGGMGEVWRARHRMLARPAAIKLIRPSVAGHARPGVSEEAVRRFEREAQVIARLRSPHTVELFDFGIAADGAFYYVMELLDGLDADSLLRRFGPIPPERAIYLLRQVCHSLSEAQSCGLVHRDIKPANIFLCRYGEEYDFVKVLDFGIVGAIRDPADANPALTRENAVQGTPAFIAPEQAMGTARGRARRHLRDRLCRLLAPDRPVRVHRRDSDGACSCSTPRPHPRLHRPGPTCRFPRHSTTSCCRVWPRTPPTGRSPPGSCRCGWEKFKARAAGPRSGRASGGRRTSSREHTADPESERPLSLLVSMRYRKGIDGRTKRHDRIVGELNARREEDGIVGKSAL